MLKTLKFFLISWATATVAIGLNEQAAAQGADFNLQTRIDAFSVSPPTPTIRPRTETVEIIQTIPGKTIQIDLSLDEREALAQTMKIAPPATFGIMSVQEKKRFYDARGVPGTKTIKTKPKVVRKTVTKVEPRPIVVRGFADTSPSYETNANNSKSDPTGDAVLSSNAGVIVAMPVGDKNDALSLTASTLLVRYSKLTSQDFDVLAGRINYAQKPDAAYWVPTFRTNGTATQDTFNAGFLTRAAFERGYGNVLARYYYPYVNWTRSNIPVGDGICGKGKDAAYCYFLNVKTEAGYTFSDAARRENLSLAGSATLGWRTPVDGLTLSTTVALKGRHYTAFPGDRDDLVLEGAAEAEWAINDNVTLSGGVTFTQAWSTQPAAEWNGFSVFPKISLVTKLN